MKTYSTDKKQTRDKIDSINNSTIIVVDNNISSSVI